MTDELKACPFCGEFPAGTINNMYVVCGTEDCPAEFDWIDIAKWQTRPLEDALRARAERADADANRLAKLLIQQQNRVKQAESMVERLIWSVNDLLKDATNQVNVIIAQSLIAEWQARNDKAPSRSVARDVRPDEEEWNAS